MTANIFKIEDGKFGLSLTDPGATDDVCAATIADFTDFGDPGGCQVTAGALTASPNVNTETIPATFCEPEQTLPQVGATSYSLELSFLQDPHIVDGISQFMFEHDAEEAWFYFGMDGDNPPKAVGKLRLVAGTIGGDARTTLTASVSLPLEGKPDVCFGDATTSDAVGPGSDPLNLTADVFGSSASAPANLATLQADGTYGDGNLTYNGGADFTTGQYVKLGDASLAHYASSAWSVGAAP